MTNVNDKMRFCHLQHVTREHLSLNVQRVLKCYLFWIFILIQINATPRVVVIRAYYTERKAEKLRKKNCMFVTVTAERERE